MVSIAHHPGDAERADRERRARDLVDLQRDREHRHRATDRRQRRSSEQPPEPWRLTRGREIDKQSSLPGQGRSFS
jgi:hypothetical protein